MRPTISETARRADLPRRTVQFWFDQEVISAGDVELVCMLRPFDAIHSPISVIKLLAVVFRDIVLGGQASDDEIELFGPLVLAARSGKPAFLLVQIVGSEDDPIVKVEAAYGMRDVGRLAISMSTREPVAPVVVVNLTEALAPRPARAAVRPAVSK